MSQEERRSVVVPVVTRGRRESGEECRFGGGGRGGWGKRETVRRESEGERGLGFN